VGDPTAITLAGQQAAEETMADRCRIRRPQGEATDPDSGAVSDTYRDPDVYLGKCKIQDSGAQARDVESGSSTVTITPLEVHIPVSAESVAVGDYIELLDDEDTVLRAFRAERPHRKTWQTAQRIPVTELEGLT
jgi:hypothetical protein